MKPMKPKHPDSVSAPREPQPSPSLAAPMLALAVFWLAAGQALAQGPERTGPVASAVTGIQVWSGTGPGFCVPTIVRAEYTSSSGFGDILGSIFGDIAEGVAGAAEEIAKTEVVAIVPTFDPARVDYITTVSGPKVTIEARGDAEVEIAVSGRSTSGEDLSTCEIPSVATTLDGLVPGRNVITVTASADDGRTTEYTLHVIVEETGVRRR